MLKTEVGNEGLTQPEQAPGQLLGTTHCSVDTGSLNGEKFL